MYISAIIVSLQSNPHPPSTPSTLFELDYYKNWSQKGLKLK